MRYCKICCEELNGNEPFFMWLLESGVLCGTCLRMIKIIDKSIRYDGLKIHFLYEENDFMKQLWHQYHEKDVALAEVFLYPFQRMLTKKYARNRIVCIVVEEEKELVQRMFQIRNKGIEIENEDMFLLKEHKKQYKDTIVFLIHRTKNKAVIDKIKTLHVKKIICLFYET